MRAVPEISTSLQSLLVFALLETSLDGNVWVAWFI